MAHFAELNESGLVTQVVAVSNAELMDDGVESEAKGVELLRSIYGHDNWKQTSYNGNMRKNYAGIGFSYDSIRDAFIPPKPFPSWTLDESSCRWAAPVLMPEDGKLYRWDEQSLEWVAILP